MAPTFERVLQDVRCEERELLTLSVKIAANPAPEITWLVVSLGKKHSGNPTGGFRTNCDRKSAD